MKPSCSCQAGAAQGISPLPHTIIQPRLLDQNPCPLRVKAAVETLRSQANSYTAAHSWHSPS